MHFIRKSLKYVDRWVMHIPSGRCEEQGAHKPLRTVKWEINERRIWTEGKTFCYSIFQKNGHTGRRADFRTKMVLIQVEEGRRNSKSIIIIVEDRSVSGLGSAAPVRSTNTKSCSAEG